MKSSRTHLVSRSKSPKCSYTQSEHLESANSHFPKATWEQRYIAESTMRQIAVDAASVPKIKDMEAKLAEKDAMIKVLQQHSQDKDAVFQNCVLGRPPRHARSASTVGLTTSTCHTTTTTGVSSLGRVSPSPTNTLHRRTGSASGSLLSISSESSSTALPSQSSPVTESVTATKKSLDEQLKELDSRLSSKDSIISALRAERERHPKYAGNIIDDAQRLANHSNNKKTIDVQDVALAISQQSNKNFITTPDKEPRNVNRNITTLSSNAVNKGSGSITSLNKPSPITSIVTKANTTTIVSKPSSSTS
ncbi:hypothetical protein HNY73_000621 [Argiope bruennichi]|uniref:Angiomotin C-terminal domain-containing protein n=1 Tax=Argiope bruennichi TaxID=94029 RepID=A0A8T0FYV3_ARGBR|nr:hypothetical protein HNY73_000621 [Argiope bruennichi]